MRSLTIEYGDDVLTELGLSQQQFGEEARMIIVVKLYEMGRLSTGSAAAFAEVPKPLFLAKLADYGVDTFDVMRDELQTDTADAGASRIESNFAFDTTKDERRNKERPQVVIDPEVLSGTPCIAGTRIRAHDIADMVANGDTVAALLEAYPSLTEELVRAACAYAEAHPRAIASHEPPWRKAQPYASEETPSTPWSR